MKWPAPRRSNSVLGLAFEGGTLCVAQVDRVKSNGGTTSGAGDSNDLDSLKRLTIALDARSVDPAAAGRSLREQLDRSELREKRCVVALPSEWVMSVHAALPALSPADTDSFLQLEAERGFPCDISELQLAKSTQRIGDNVFVTLLGVRTQELTRLTELLKAAGLKPSSYTVGLAALPGAVPPDGNGLATISVGQDRATMLVTCGGGITTLRTLSASTGEESAVAREIRITLEETPALLRARLRRIRLFGEEYAITPLVAALSRWSDGEGYRIERAGPAAPTIASSVAARWMEGSADLPEFLPPRTSRWQDFSKRYQSRRYTGAIAVVAAVLVAVIGAFAWREYQVWSLRSEWARMQPQVTELETVQARIREYRSWHDTSFRTLNILRFVTEVFPENGTVTAKTFEIRGQNLVTVTGITRDNTALLDSLEKLRQRREVTHLKIEQIRGKSPAQFTFNFQLARTPGT